MAQELAPSDLMIDETERAWLVRYCARLSGQPESAEDMAQETLIEAWRNRHKLSDPTGRLPWLAAIARHVARRWGRARGRELERLAPLEAGEEAEWQPWLQDGVDFEQDLERAELAALLDRALALLPAETRLALIAHYVEELPQAEIAAKLGLSVGTLGVRLHRGKLALRTLFATELREEAAAYGLGGTSSTGWQQHLQGQLDADNCYLIVRCPTCALTPLVEHQTSLLRGVTSCRAAFNRVIEWASVYYPSALQTGFARCTRCGQMAPLRTGLPFPMPGNREETSIHVACTCPM